LWLSSPLFVRRNFFWDNFFFNSFSFILVSSFLSSEVVAVLLFVGLLVLPFFPSFFVFVVVGTLLVSFFVSWAAAVELPFCGLLSPLSSLFTGISVLFFAAVDVGG